MDDFNICLEEDMVFIYIGSVSSREFTKEYSFNIGNKKISYVFESVSYYYSFKPPDYDIDDILLTRIDYKQDLLSEKKIRKAKRLNNLVSIISFYMRYTTRKIVVIGVSLGSLLVHSAILKIKGIYRPLEHLLNIFENRIIVLTLGSPKYLPISLLSHENRNSKFGNVYNFYNTTDGIYDLLDLIRNIGFNSLSYLKIVPSLAFKSRVSRISSSSDSLVLEIFLICKIFNENSTIF
jgi:hypothetical protein